MKLRTTNWALLALTLILAVTMVTDDALAQRRGGSSSSSSNQTTRAQTWQKPPMEVSLTYGHMWGGNIQGLYGRIRTDTGNTWGIALDIPLHPFAMLELSYTRQDGGLTWDPNGGPTEPITGMSVNFWQIGANKGLVEGPVRPFVSMSIGVTYMNFEESSVIIDGTEYYADSTTKLSFSFGVGAKAFFGEAERFGLVGTFKVYPTMYNTGAGIYFGTGGGGVGISGNAVWQWEVAGGLTVKLGK